MSKDRARRRAERERLSIQRAAVDRAKRDRALARSRRQQRRALAWRRLRLWRRGSASQRTKERRVLVGGIVFAVLVASYLITRSIPIVIGVTLVAAIATPALVAFGDRSTK